MSSTFDEFYVTLEQNLFDIITRSETSAFMMMMMMMMMMIDDDDELFLWYG